jgi:hypothetical protein
VGVRRDGVNNAVLDGFETVQQTIAFDVVKGREIPSSGHDH